METNQPISNADQPDQWQTVVLPIIARIWGRRKAIAVFVLAVSLLTAGATFLIQPMYTAQTSVLPELTKERTLGLAGLASLSEATGLNIGETPVSKLYPMIVRSERVLREVIYHPYNAQEYPQPANLIEYWEISGNSDNEMFDKALKELRKRLDVSFDMRLGTVTISVEMEEPQLAADVANQVTAEMDTYTRTKRTTNATRQREFIEQRMEEVEETLKRSEVALKGFRERNRRIADSPQLILEEGRLNRDVEINSTVFIELKKQLEIAKIEEIKNIPIINVLDAARPPVRKSYPIRSTMVIMAFALSLLVSLGYVSISDRLYSIKEGIKDAVGQKSVKTSG